MGLSPSSRKDFPLKQHFYRFMKRLHCNEQILIYVGIDIPGIVPFFQLFLTKSMTSSRTHLLFNHSSTPCTPLVFFFLSSVATTPKSLLSSRQTMTPCCSHLHLLHLLCRPVLPVLFQLLMTRSYLLVFPFKDG